MLNFEHVGVRILVGIVVIILAFVLLKYFTSDSESSITEYAAPVPKRPQGILKSPKKLIQKLQQLPPAKKPAEWAPSPIDDTMSPYGDFSTNRFPSSFVSNVTSGSFPENDEFGASAARKTKWTPEFPQNFAVSSLTAIQDTSPLPSPPLGGDDPFHELLGASLDN